MLLSHPCARVNVIVRRGLDDGHIYRCELTPLGRAIKGGDIGVIDVLVRAGARINIPRQLERRIPKLKTSHARGNRPVPRLHHAPLTLAVKSVWKTGAYEVLRHVLVAEFGPGVLTLPDSLFPLIFLFCRRFWLGVSTKERRKLCRGRF